MARPAALDADGVDENGAYERDVERRPAGPLTRPAVPDVDDVGGHGAYQRAAEQRPAGPTARPAMLNADDAGRPRGVAGGVWSFDAFNLTVMAAPDRGLEVPLKPERVVVTTAGGPSAKSVFFGELPEKMSRRVEVLRIPFPQGRVFKGHQDERYIRPFLLSVATRSRGEGLDKEAAMHYLNACRLGIGLWRRSRRRPQGLFSRSSWWRPSRGW
jgi:hypothetical protein